jgi:hypothetical protein
VLGDGLEKVWRKRALEISAVLQACRRLFHHSGGMTNALLTPTKIDAIDPAFNGPPDSAHGGVAAGRFAEIVNPSHASVRFSAPIPVGVELRAYVNTNFNDSEARVYAGQNRIASVRSLSVDLEFEGAEWLPSGDVDRAQRQSFAAGPDPHPFPTCYGCGNTRSKRRGLNLRPGSVDGESLYACRWIPRAFGEVPDWMVWAALDCPSGAPAVALAGPEFSVVTGVLAVSIAHPITGSREYQLQSRATSRDGRKIRTEAVLVDSNDRALATAAATWITIPSTRKSDQ